MNALLVRERDDSTAVIGVSGEIDVASCDEIESTIHHASLLWARVLIDVSGVTFCGSAGLGMFIRCEQKARERGGELLLVKISPRIRRFFEIAALEHLLESSPVA